ncbi:zmpB [Symbiodinium sp. CCMP2592]|nr:zmpB [Symbiodinium sp. CCMP2592]
MDLVQGAQDEKGRTDVFESVVSMICEEGSRGCLLFFILENSSHLADANHAEFLNEMLLRLEVSLPYFLVDTVKKDAAEFLPVKRGRFFIRGLRRDCLPDPMQAFLPAPLCCTDLLPAVTLEEILDLSLAATDVQSLCAGHAANLTLYKQTISQCIEEHRAQGKPLPSNTVVVELDRNPLRTFGGKWGWGKIPSLRTTGPPLFLLSCEDLSRPWQVMRLHRWLSIAERCSALGQRASHAALFSRDTHALHAIGNALSPVQLAAVASPLVEAAVNSGVLTAGNRCKACAVELLPHTKPPGTSAACILEKTPRPSATKGSKPKAAVEEATQKTRKPRAKSSAKPKASTEEASPKTRTPKAKTATKPKVSTEEVTPKTRNPKANRVRKPRAPTEEEAPKTLPRDTSAKPEASAEEEAPKTLPRDTSTKPEASAEEEAPKTLPRDRDTSTKPEASAEEEAPKTLPRDTSTKPEASAEEEAPKTLPQLERLVDELFSDDDPGMDVDDAAPQSPLVLSEKATHLFECLAKAKASSKNWLSPASKSSKNESEPAQSSGSKVGDRRRRSTSSGRDMPENAQRKLRFPPHLNLPKEAIHLSDSD